ncbi:MAG: hypothetical protein PHW74_12350 [Desulfobacca sp.]|nr:hypothetical protein [Desulfobacca sp.]
MLFIGRGKQKAPRPKVIKAFAQVLAVTANKAISVIALANLSTYCKMKKRTPPHQWTFPSRFRARAYGWRGSKLACQRIREAISEIKKVYRKDPILGVEGAIRLIEKMSPAFEQIDTSSGALGIATYNAVETLVKLISEAPADYQTRDQWLDRLWTAYQADGYGLLDNLEEHWGELCGFPEVASRWADDLIWPTKLSWAEEVRSYFRGTIACLSCLCAARRYQELMELLELAPYLSWHYRQFGVRALVARGQKAEALKYAQASYGLNDPKLLIDQTCEDILLSSGLAEEAYQRYALSANAKHTGIATFRAIAQKYPHKDKAEILKDLIASTPGAEGRWFATAKELGFYEIAIAIARHSPCEPKTLNRAAKDYLAVNPHFALDSAWSSLKWLAEGYGYEVTGLDVLEAFELASQAAEKLGRVEEVNVIIGKIVGEDKSPGMFVKKILGSRLKMI